MTPSFPPEPKTYIHKGGMDVVRPLPWENNTLLVTCSVYRFIHSKEQQVIRESVDSLCIRMAQTCNTCNT